jgi:thiol:disulfide interchange protein DsbG
MLLSVAPSGQAMVAGIPADISVARLRALASSGVTDLGERHGMQGLLVRNGDAFQVFYATPGGERVIPGVMWDATGKNLTREQVSSVEGTIPTVTIGDVPVLAPAVAVTAPRAPTPLPIRSASAPAPGALAAAERTAAGTVGNAAAPHLWMFADPQCGYSVQAMQRLQPLVASGRVRLSVVPVAILDHQNAGRSTTESLAMLSKPGEQMVAAWSRGDLQGPQAVDAAARLRGNMEAAKTIGLRGTPTLVWRRADGTEGRQDGMPSDVDALVASMQGG